MEIENHKEEVPFAHYEVLFRALNPQEVLSRLPDTQWDGVPPLPTQTFLLRYLLEGKNIKWNGQWKTFREMPWGEMYIQPYTGRVLTRAAFTFGTRLDAFRKASEKMGAVKLPHGDAGYQFELVSGYRMQILVWEGDEEFPPNDTLYTALHVALPRCCIPTILKPALPRKTG